MLEKVDGILREVFKEEIAREENPGQLTEYILTPGPEPIELDIRLPGPKPFSHDALKNVLKRRPNRKHKPKRRK